ncbi:MAG TPA: hypothetical protein VF703_09160 [Pyrinomonadaceae bacterium]
MTESRESWLRRQRIQTDQLKRRALLLGIEIPSNPTWWWEDFDNFGGSIEQYELERDDYTYLTDAGKVGVRKLIRDEQRKELEWKRKNIEWWIKIIVTLITALTGLVGSLIGVFAILRK